MGDNQKILLDDLVSFNQTLGCLRETPTSEGLVKSHDIVCKAKTM